MKVKLLFATNCGHSQSWHDCLEHELAKLRKGTLTMWDTVNPYNYGKLSSGGSKGRVRGVRPPTIRPDAYKQDIWIAVVRTCTHALTSWLCHWCWWNLYNLCNQTKEEDVCSKGASFTSRIQVNGRQPRNYNVQPRLVGSRGFGGEVICLKRILSEPKFGPPNQKFLDPPLLSTFKSVSCPGARFWLTVVIFRHFAVHFVF